MWAIFFISHYVFVYLFIYVFVYLFIPSIQLSAFDHKFCAIVKLQCAVEKGKEDVH